MQLKLTIVLLALCAFVNGSHLKSDPHNLSKFILQSRAAIEDNPKRSVFCFDDYANEMTELGSVYKDELVKCTSESEDSLIALDATFAGNRDELAASAVSVCQLLSNCGANEKVADFFKCHSTAASDASRLTFSIGSQADQYTKDVTQMQSEISYTKSQCDTVSKKKYETSVGSCYISLQYCISASASESGAKAVNSKVVHQTLFSN